MGRGSYFIVRCTIRSEIVFVHVNLVTQRDAEFKMAGLSFASVVHSLKRELQFIL